MKPVYVRDIDPRRHKNPLFSNRLFRYVRKAMDGVGPVKDPRPIKLRIYKDANGFLWICRGQLRFIGGKWEMYCVKLNHTLMDFEPVREYIRTFDKEPCEIKTFWQQYAKKGVCFVDPWHRWMGQTKDRAERWEYSKSKKKRTCRYCGRVEVLKTYKRRVTTTLDLWQLPAPEKSPSAGPPTQ